MPVRIASAAFTLSIVMTLSCNNQPKQIPLQAPRENVILQSHTAPQCYRFDVRLNEARVTTGMTTDETAFRYRFDFEKDAPPWTITQGNARSVIEDGALAISTESIVHCDSPVMTELPASGVQAIVIEAKVSGCSQFKLAWRDEREEFQTNSETPIDVPHTGAWTSYSIETAHLHAWAGHDKNISQLRLIVPANAHLEIRSIRLAGNVDPFAGKPFGEVDYLYRRGHVHSVFVRTPSSLEYDVTVMANARLTTGYLHRMESPTQFRVLLKDGPDQTVLVEGEEDDDNSMREMSADLSRWAGKNVQIRFEVESQQPGTVALWCNPRLARAYPVSEVKRPINVIWYVIDCLRAPNVHAYGYERETTPTIDSVAQEGARFEWCFSPGSWTIDSVPSFFTGLSPIAHGLNRTHSRIPDSIHRLPEILRNAGYATAMFSQNPYLVERRGFVKGFDESHQFRVRDHAAIRTSATVDSYPINVSIADFLREHKEDPLFLYVHTIEPHHPYVPPATMRKFFKPDGSAGLTEVYDDCILWADANLGYTIEMLKEVGLWNNTLMIVSADHGECLPDFDNGKHGHGLKPYLPRMHIPLVMRLPGIIPEGLVIPENVQGLDIPTTLLDLLHMEPDPQFGGDSLMGLIDGTKKAEFAERTIFPTGELPKWQAVVRGNWFYHDNNGKGELTDLHVIPPGKANAIETHPEIAQELLTASQKFRVTESLKAKQYVSNKTETVVIDPEDRQALEALGYVGAALTGAQ